MDIRGKARDDFIKNNSSLIDPVTLHAPIEMRDYLQNRIEKAFLDGLDAGVLIAQEEAIKRFRELFAV